MATPIPENLAAFTLAELAAITGGELRAGAAETVVSGICTDSRGKVKDKLFVAIQGERFDGHRFVADALGRGASAAVVARHVGLDVTGPLLCVADPLEALGRIARAHRRRWGGTVVAVAGSAGKTTTRSVTAALLDAVVPGGVHPSPGNLNNRVGVPMVLLGLERAHRVCVVEVGTNRRGEVAELAAVTEPDVSVLTLVGVEHTEGLGGIDEIEAEEGALLLGASPAGAAIANADDPRARRQLGRAPSGTRLSFGHADDADYQIVRRHAVGLNATRVVVRRASSREELTLSAPLLGAPAAYALAASIAAVDAVAASRGVALASSAELGSALARGAVGEPGRLQPILLGDGTVVLDDSYNANPASVRAALSTAAELSHERKARLVLVLGEMRELGTLSASEHDAVALDLASSGAAVLVAVAGDAARFVDPARRHGIVASFASDADEASSVVLANLRPGDVVLVKASRSIGIERVVTTLLRAKGRAA